MTAPTTQQPPAEIDWEALRHDAILRYQAGESLRALAGNLRVPPKQLRKHFVAWGVEIRDARAAHRLRPSWGGPLDSLQSGRRWNP